MSLDVNKPFEFDGDLRYTGSHPNSLALSPDESRIYVTMGGTNSLAVFDLENEKVKRNQDKKAKLLGLIPTGWYPSSVSLDAKASIYMLSMPFPPLGQIRKNAAQLLQQLIARIRAITPTNTSCNCVIAAY